MKKKKRLIIAILAILVVVLAVVVILVTGKSQDNGDGAKSIDIEDITMDDSARGISIVSIDTIAGMYVEDGTDEVLDNILSVTFRNDTDHYLQYAKLTLTVGKEEYEFDISTLPPDATVRAMEINRKNLVSGKGDVTLSQENIVWFDKAPSMCEDVFEITVNENAIALKNISGEAISAPAYVYYKNVADGEFVGGITYRTGTQGTLEPDGTVVLSARHFDPETSRLMFVTYGN